MPACITAEPRIKNQGKQPRKTVKESKQGAYEECSRSPILPDVPTIAEAGVTGFHATLWVGFMAPASTPQPIVDLLNHTITTVLKRPDIRAAWEKRVPLVMSQQEFQSFMAAEVVK
jgi:tripartite-type tricarboxylate transporter receptor subunit TctC